ncbi:hypothetical protein Zmor_013219 [Zophobas morio]|uniref:Uncharacterized protein n=1 Tax=Zophobas morio TaxID=2755281 RepID=A0AA38IFB2_9CUCU|nr:hypothetical protein Zmor_013219 [Zophobas morio]
MADTIVSSGMLTSLYDAIQDAFRETAVFAFSRSAVRVFNKCPDSTSLRSGKLCLVDRKMGCADAMRESSDAGRALFDYGNREKVPNGEEILIMAVLCGNCRGNEVSRLWVCLDEFDGGDNIFDEIKACLNSNGGEIKHFLL